ncbi:Alpha/Beta hydrolase protein [Xylogone sp. PMI_703]|nr:Alpha/Beta hydrolase protein [Xylogone sp. PMI_703]
MLIHILSVIGSFIFVVSAVPATLGVRFDERSSMPTLTLPYGTWKASDYNPISKIYTFKNIRFAAPPVGDLRWQKPAPPAHVDTIQDGSYGPQCIQGFPKGLNFMGKGNDSPIGTAANQFLAGIPVPSFQGASEDCLFLDVYVPAKAINNPKSKLPVVVWIFGGAFLFGSKDTYQPLFPFYDGSGLVYNSGGEMIFVAGNYRLGALGWLSGTTMEKDGVPNVGLWDQRAVFSWVQSYISLLGGDPKQVTAMGESAGAGSLMHHLIAEGGKLDPMFTKAILQSPAYEFLWDRSGVLEETFQEFTAFAGCAGKGLSCLRTIDSTSVQAASTKLNAATTVGAFSLGASVDGSFIRQLPPLELASGNFWKLDSLIISHTADESGVFVDGHISTDAEFSTFVNAIFPNYTIAAGVSTLVEEFYPPISTNHTYSSESARVEAFVRDSSFTCNTRYLTEAYGDSKCWNMQYSVTPGWHATDLIPTFYSFALSADTFLEGLAFTLVPLFLGITKAYQSYLTSFITTGNPNTKRAILNIPSAISWPHPNSSGNQISGVLNVGDWGFSTISDSQNEKASCEFWRELAAAVANLGGYAPPGSVVSQSLIHVPNNASANYA